MNLIISQVTCKVSWCKERWHGHDLGFVMKPWYIKRSNLRRWRNGYDLIITWIWQIFRWRLRWEVLWAISQLALKKKSIYFLYSALDHWTQYLCALQWIYTTNCGQVLLLLILTMLFNAAWSILLCPAIQVESGWGICCSHQTGGWTPAYTVATFPGHNNLQLTPIEFQDRGSNPVLLSQWIQQPKANCYNH